MAMNVSFSLAPAMFAALNGWDGDSDFRRVEDGAIVGETTKDHQPQQNTFLIWRGGSPANFELRLDYKLTGSVVKDAKRA